MSAVFTYRDLEAADSIRLLLLQSRAGSKNDEIHCNLQHVTLSEFEDDITLQFNALSYVWGNEEDQRNIFVDGIDFHVTLNLFRALRSIRHESKEITLWVDAICINQKNIKERSQQVGFMGSIYASAANTIIYLGESDEKSDWAIQTLKGTGSPALSSGGPLDDVSLKEIINSSILARSWFTRIWVLQELALSRNPIIQCGISRVRWAKLSNFIHSMKNELYDDIYASADDKVVRFPVAESRMMYMQNAREKIQLRNITTNKGYFPNKHQTLLDLVISRSGLGAKDPRDIIFAHIGMVNYTNAERIGDIARSQARACLPIGEEKGNQELSLNVLELDSPTVSSSLWSDTESRVDSEWNEWIGTEQETIVDYEKSVVEVYNEFARRSIEKFLDMTVTDHIQSTYPQARLPGLASWAPDWTLSRQRQIVPIEPSPYNEHVGVTFGTVHQTPIFVRGSSVLGVIGYPLSLIKQTSDVINLYYPDLPHYIDLGEEPLEDPFQEVNDGGCLDEDVMLYRNIYERWRKKLGIEVLPPLVGRDLPRLDRLDADDYCHSALRRQERTRRSDISWVLGRAGHYAPAQLSLADRLIHAGIVRKEARSEVDGRRVALLANGSTTLVPPYAEKGDILCVISLCKNFVILRMDTTHQDSSTESSLRFEFNKVLKSPENYTKLDILQTGDLPLRHSTFIGDCLVDGLVPFPFEKLGERREYHIFALH